MKEGAGKMEREERGMEREKGEEGKRGGETVPWKR